jgi:DNA-3-methyladenine glycosylase I
MDPGLEFRLQGESSLESDKVRCDWAKIDPVLMEYHDKEWGVPVHDDSRLFEFLVLEGAQAGLSWLTILKRRDNYRNAFAEFDPKKVAKFSESKILSLKENPGIIRNDLKIRSAVKNARCVLAIQKEFGSFDKFVWTYSKSKPNRWKTMGQVPATTTISDTMSKDLKARGFGFVGSTICYSFMQAVGIVNDHLVTCYRAGQV